MTSSGAVRRLHADAMSAVITPPRREYAVGSDPRRTTMVSRMLSYLRPVRVTVAYAVLLVVVAVTQLALGPQVHNAVVNHMSTNLHKLSQGHVGTLVGSAFVTDGGDIYVLLPGLVCLLALGELVWRSGYLVIAFAFGHIGATTDRRGRAGRRDRGGVVTDLNRACQRRGRQLWRRRRVGRSDSRDTASVATGLGRLVVGHRAGRHLRGRLHRRGAHGRPAAGHGAVLAARLGRALDTRPCGVARGRGRVRLRDDHRVVAGGGGRERPSGREPPPAKIWAR
jgi:hypothetical protein